MNLDITQLLNQLHNQAVHIHFTKADGTSRIMRATLQAHMLPERMTTSHAKPNPQVLKVWDMDKQAWRSVRLDRIQETHVV
jgi:hypothetical protein